MNQQQQIDEITQIDKTTQMLELYLELGGDSYDVACKALDWARTKKCVACLDGLACGCGEFSAGAKKAWQV